MMAITITAHWSPRPSRRSCMQHGDDKRDEQYIRRNMPSNHHHKQHQTRASTSTPANAACCKVPGTSFRANQVEPREPNKLLKSQKPKQHLHSYRRPGPADSANTLADKYAPASEASQAGRRHALTCKHAMVKQACACNTSIGTKHCWAQRPQKRRTRRKWN